MLTDNSMPEVARLSAAPDPYLRTKASQQANYSSFIHCVHQSTKKQAKAFLEH